MFIALISLSHVGNAILNNISFKNITKQFKPEYQHLSPTVGKAALERGLIYNLRFFGPLTPKFEEGTGKRLYSSDEGQDALMKLLILLFPSSAGELASSSLGASNFGKHATPEMVAMLLNYAHEYREEKLQTNSTETGTRQKSFKKRKDPAKTNTSSKDPINTDLSLIVTKTKRFGVFDLPQETPKPASDSSSDSESDGPVSLKQLLIAQGMGSGDAGKIEKTIKKNIIDSIDAESNHDNPYPYPAYTTEQIILAFFCHKFNEKGDLWTLLDHLNPALLDRKADFGDDSDWDKESLIHIASMQSHANSVSPHPSAAAVHNDEGAPMLDTQLATDTHPVLDIDLIFALNFINLGAPLPYKANMSPASNANCPFFDRSLEANKTSGLNDKITFADCADITIRHFANIMFYDQAQNKFILPKFEEFPSPYYANLADFYRTQTPKMANDGSERIRGLWNRVVADLNWNGTDRTQNSTSIRYNKQTDAGAENEVDTGFVNFIKIWQKLLGASLVIAPYDASWTLVQKKTWLENSLKKLIQTLNPTFKEISIDFNGNITEGHNKDLFGNITFKIKNSMGCDFSFSLYQSLDHGTLNSIRYKVPLNTKENYPFGIETLNLINSEERSVSLYQILANEELSSDGQKLNQIKKITQKITHMPNTLIPVISNVLNSINVDDSYTRNGYINACKVILDLLDIDFKNIFILRIKAIDIDMFKYITKHRILTPNLTHIDFTINFDATYTTDFKVPASLKFMKASLIKEDLDLTEATQLEELELGSGSAVDKLIAGPGLKKLTLAGKLDHLDLSQATQLKHINLSSSSEIKTLNTGSAETIFLDSGSAVDKLITGPGLKDLSLYGKLDHLDLSQTTQLKTIYLGKSFKIKILITGATEEIDADDDFEVGKLIAGPGLKKLTLTGNVVLLDLSQATQLEELHLVYKYAVNKLIAGPGLKKLTLTGNVGLLDLTKASPEIIIKGEMLLVNNIILKKGQVFRNFSPDQSKVRYVE